MHTTLKSICYIEFSEGNAKETDCVAGIKSEEDNLPTLLASTFFSVIETNYSNGIQRVGYFSS